MSSTGGWIFAGVPRTRFMNDCCCDVESLSASASVSAANTFKRDEYEPAYHYGEAARARHQGRQWDEMEPQLRGDWESSEPGTWDRFKGAIRHAWDRATS